MKTKTAHTPGPRMAEDGRVIVYDSDTVIFSADPDAKHPAGKWSVEISGAHARADVERISSSLGDAAPDLLMACEIALNGKEPYDGYIRTMLMMAIAKAGAK